LHGSVALGLCLRAKCGGSGQISVESESLLIARFGEAFGFACLRQHIFGELESLGRNLRAKVGLNHLQCHLLHAPFVRTRFGFSLCRGSAPGGGQSAAHVNGLHHGGTQPNATHAGWSSSVGSDRNRQP
jgi:hypothetical protein